jgi:hypothetical protein
LELASEVSGPPTGALVADAVATQAPELRDAGDSYAVAGPAAVLGMSPIQVVCELAATFELALEILKQEAIVRVTRGSERRIVGLCHDALGDQLLARHDSMRSWSASTIDSLIIVSGERVLGDVLKADTAEREKDWRRSVHPPDYTNLDYLNWVGCQVTASFSGVIFRNCTFSGSIFNRCRFENVRFENCTMWGATFMNCEFVGSDDVVIEGDEKLGRISCLSFLWRPEYLGTRFGFESGGALRFRNIGGSGLFVIDATGGPLLFEKVGRGEEVLDHVKIEGLAGGALGPIEIIDSELRHFQVGKYVDRPVLLSKDPTIRFADSASDVAADLFEAVDTSLVSYEGPGEIVTSPDS